jgi:hypothetical protein
MSAGAAIGGEIAIYPLKKDILLLSPQDVIIECKDKRIGCHSIVVRRCTFFATLLDSMGGTYGPDNIKTITLPTTFDHDPSQVREFLMMLYNIECDGALARYYLSKENVIALTELAHYFGAAVLKAACDEALARNHSSWFPGELPWLAEAAAKNHLKILRMSLKRGCCSTSMKINKLANTPVNGRPAAVQKCVRTDSVGILALDTARSASS